MHFPSSIFRRHPARPIHLLLRRCAVGCAALAGVVSAALGASPLLPAKGPIENYDRRFVDLNAKPAKGVATATVAPTLDAATAQLAGEVKGVRVDRDLILHAPKFIASNREFLTGPGGSGGSVSKLALSGLPAATDGLQTVRAFVNTHDGLFGFRSDLLDHARITRDDTTTATGLRTVVWQQELDGLPIFESVFKSNLSAKGALMNVSSAFLANPAAAADLGTPNRAAVMAKPPIAPATALATAAATAGAELHPEETIAADAPQGVALVQHFQAKFHLAGTPEARLVWLPMDANTLRLCWQTLLVTRSNRRMYLMLVDAQTGEVLVRHGLTNDAASSSQYTVFTGDSPTPLQPGHSSSTDTSQPAGVARQTVTLTALNTTASPDGWVPSTANTTVGNNVDAHTDTNGDDVADPGSNVTGSPFHVFNPANDLTKSATSNSQAAVVNLFYWNNLMHDTLYGYGFTETADNFQTSNYGRGGNAGDAVQADGQDSTGLTATGNNRNNANFSTPPSGNTSYAPRMQMYFWNGTSPNRDGCYDAVTMCHEYTHGLSSRLVGGGVGISALATSGMGEGWSDFVAFSVLSNANQDLNGTFVAGAYVTYDYVGETNFANYYFGYRRHPYSTDLTKDPVTFKDIDPTQYSQHSDVPTNPVYGPSNTAALATEVHSQGEIWCSALMEMRANLINKFDYAGGNALALQLVIDGMKAAPANPNFIQARDAIFQAEMSDTDGANRAEIDDAFARRGMGTYATAPDSSTTTGVVENYHESSPPEVVITFPVDGANYASFTNFTGTASDGGLGGSGIAGNLLTLTLVDNGTGKYWTGTTYTDSPAALNTQVNSDGTWTYSGALPSDATLGTGSYTLSVTAVDNDNNVSSPAAGTSQIVFTVKAANPPYVSVTTPSNGSDIQSFSNGVSGTALDYSGTGIAGNVVDFTLYNISNNTYWSGTDWESNAVILTAPYNPSTNIWTYTGALPSDSNGNLLQGQYSLSAYTSDNTGKGSAAAAVNNIQFIVDSIPPSLFINSPADGSTIATLESPTGSLVDSTSGPSYVNLFLHRFSDNSYWNGSQWVVFNGTYPILRATVDSSGNWTYNQGLPLPGNNTATSLTNGQYELIAVGGDKAGNKTQVTNAFTEDFAYTWTGATLRDGDSTNDSNSWNTAANWYPAGIPGAGDKAVIINGDSIDLGGDQTVRALVLGGGSTISNNSVTLTGTGSSIGSSAVMSNTTIKVASGATLTMDTTGAPQLSGATLNNAGTLVLSPSDASNPNYLEGNNSTLNNLSGGVIQLARDGQCLANIYNTSTLNNAGTITKTAGTGASTFGDWAFQNQTAGSLGSTSGTLGINAGGGATLADGTTLGPGTVAFSNATTVNGTLTSVGSVHFQSGITCNAATLVQGAGGSLNLDSGNFSGTVVVPAGTTLAVDTTGAPQLTSATLNNAGTLVLSASDANNPNYLEGNSATLNNLSGGTIRLARDGQCLANIYNASTLNNAGTITKTAGTGASNFGDWAFQNQTGGSLGSTSGTLGINTGGGVTLASGSKIGPGSVVLSGTVTLNGQSTVTADLHLQGSVTFNTASLVPSAGGTLHWDGGNFYGTVVVLAGTTLAVDTTGAPQLAGATLNNAGTLVLSASDANNPNYLEGNSATLNNLTGGTIQLARDGQCLANIYNASTLTNAGTITKTVGTGTSNLGDFTFENQSGGSFGATIGTLVLVSGTSTLDAGNKIGPGTVDLAGPVTFNGQTTVTGSVHLQSSMTFNAAKLAQGTGGSLYWDSGNFYGTLGIPAGTTLAVDTTGSPQLAGATLNNSGTISVNASDAANPNSLFGNSSTFNNLSGGSVLVTRTGLVFANIYNSSTFNNESGGRLLKTLAVSGRSELDWTLDNNGTVESDSGTLALNGGSATLGDAGTFNFNGSASRVEFSGGTHVLKNGTQFTGTGQALLTGGEVSVTGAISISSGSIAVTGGTLGGTGSLSMTKSTGTSTFNGGSISTLVNIQAGAALSIDTSGTPQLSSATLNNAGTITISASNAANPNSLFGNNSTLNNQSGGVINLAREGQVFTNQYNASTLVNAGTISKTTGTSCTIGDFVLDERGTLNAAAGTTLLLPTGMTVNAASQITGPGKVASSAITLNAALGIASGSTLEFGSQGGTLTGPLDSNNKPLGAINGPGALQVTAGTLTGTINLGATLLTTVDDTNVPTFSSLVLNNSGTITLTGAASGSISGNNSTLNNLANATVQFLASTALNNSYNASTFANAGTVHLGPTPVVVTTDWAYTQTSTGVLDLTLAGTNAATPQFSQVRLNGAATPGGTLQADLGTGYLPPNKAAFPIVTFASAPQADFAKFLDPNVPTGTVLTKTDSATGITLAAGVVPKITSALTLSTLEGAALTPAYQIVATQTPTAYNATSLPAGLTIDKTKGIISGTPTAFGTFDVLLTATNSAGNGTATLVLTVKESAPVITSATGAAGNVGSVFPVYQIAATHSPTSFAATGLPPGLTLNTSGAIAGTPTKAGTYAVALSAVNSGGAGTATLTITIKSLPVITSATTALGNAGSVFTYDITATNTPTSYKATGPNATALPTGLSVNASSGVLSGTPTKAGTYPITLTATNASGAGTATLSLTVTSLPVITSATTAHGNAGSAFTYDITATNTPTSFKATGPNATALPTGLTVNAISGVLSGTPTKAGTYPITLTATNASGAGTATLSLTVTALPVITSATTATGNVGSVFDVYQIKATNTPTSYSAAPLPAGLVLSASGAITGTPKTVGTTSVTLTAKNASGAGTAVLTFTVKAALPVITSATKAAGTVGTAVTAYHITATNSPTSFKAAPLPAGLTLSAAGTISGTPTKAGTTSVILTASNSGGQSAPITLTVTVSAAVASKELETSAARQEVSDGTASVTRGMVASKVLPRIISARIVDAQLGKPFEYRIAANCVCEGFATGPLPRGLEIDGSNGRITGTAEEPGTFKVRLTAVTGDSTLKGTLLLTITDHAVPVPTIAGVLSMEARADLPLSYEPVASGNPVAFSAEGLPEGVAIDEYTGCISGTPTTAGTYTIKLAAANQGGTGTAKLTLTVVPAPVPVVIVTATTPTVAIASGTAGVLTLSLTDPLPRDLYVDYEVTGSAANGLDYHLLSGTQKIPAGRTTAKIKIVPRGDLGGASSREVTFVFKPGNDYNVNSLDPIKVEITSEK